MNSDASLAEITEVEHIVLSTDHMPFLLQPLRQFLQPHGQMQHVYLSNMTATCTIIERLAAKEGADLVPFMTPFAVSGGATSRALELLLGFIDLASPPAVWDLPRVEARGEVDEKDEEEDLSFEECEKVIADGKALLIRAVVALTSEMDISDDNTAWFWNRMRDWATRQRDDLVSCALLAFGNAARQGEISP